jgi:UDP-2-acetamido-2-deoxy-ribo-hexuluronate aminotransferase
MLAEPTIVFADLKTQYRTLKDDIDGAIQTVLDHGQFIMGPEVSIFEKELAEHCGSAHSVSCGSGTDAILMILMAEGVGPGDAIFLPSFTFTATAEVVLLLGATPVFVDVDRDDFNIDCGSLQMLIDQTRAEGKLRLRGILGVDLFGQPADYHALAEIAQKEDMMLWADAAQSFGGAISSRKVGVLARATAVSFFPAKPLGCYGDGGAILTAPGDLGGAWI